MKIFEVLRRRQQTHLIPEYPEATGLVSTQFMMSLHVGRGIDCPAIRYLHIPSVFLSMFVSDCGYQQTMMSRYMTSVRTQYNL